MSDIGHLLTIINQLVEGGNKGRRVMFEGTPRQLLGVKQSLTSHYLQD